VTTLAAWAAASPSGRPDAAELRARLDQILSSGYQLTEPPQVRLHDFGLRLLRLLAELLSGIGQTRPLAGLPSWGKPVLAGALLVLLVVVFAHLTRSLRSLLSDRRLGGRELAQARERRDPNTVLREAEAAFERGENLVALSRLYLAVLLRLDRRGLLSHDPARSNWENLRALGEAGPETREAMTRLTREVDACIYGGRSASVSTWERARDWADLLWSAGERS
jgi:hypothetical protein